MQTAPDSNDDANVSAACIRDMAAAWVSHTGLAGPAAVGTGGERGVLCGSPALAALSQAEDGSRPE